MLMEDRETNQNAPLVAIVPIPDGFAHGEALTRIAQLAAQLLEMGMPEWELAKRLMRYHPAQEGV
jgi:hypothetical protein